MDHLIQKCPFIPQCHLLHSANYIPSRAAWLLCKESIFNLLTGFGESAVFVPLHKEGDRISISKHCVFNEICTADPPTMARLIRSR